MPDIWDRDIESETHKLTDPQVVRLFDMCCHLRDNPNDLNQIASIKLALVRNDDFAALAMWDEFTEAEKTVLWVAPKFGGLFTTEERKRLKPETRSEA